MPYYSQENPQMRFGPTLPPVIKRLIIANIAIFVFQQILGESLLGLLGLVPKLAVSKLMFWQFFTYMFLHGGLWHLLINMFILWMFGSDLERKWGGRKFLHFYFTCGIGAGIIYYLSALKSLIPTIGASGAIFGILAAFGMTFPERMVTLLLFFFFPVNMKAKHLVLLFAVIELLALPAGEGKIAHFAHLGGMLVGYLYLKLGGGYGKFPTLDEPLFRLQQWRVRQQSSSKPTYEEKDIDAILDKISRQGLGSLTSEERKILRRKSRNN